MKNNLKKGMSLVEVVIGGAIVTLLIGSLIASLNLFLNAETRNTAKIQSSFLTEEGLEAIRFLRDNSWTTNISPLLLDTPYYLSFDTTWHITSTNVYIDSMFERSFLVEAVYRNGSDDISDSGILDPNTKKITVSVSWREGHGTTTKTMTAYLTNLFNN